jgi:ABC-type dipeptide/oligopeptide/nickel transport system permease subunit
LTATREPETVEAAESAAWAVAGRYEAGAAPPDADGLGRALHSDAGEALWRHAWRRLSRNRLALLGLCVIGVFTALALLAPLVAPHDPVAQELSQALQPPSTQHPMGTDNFGRDILSRLVYGARISLFIGLLSQVLALSIGVTLGALSGYFRGWVDSAVLWITNVVWSFPFLLFAIALVAALGPSIRNVFIAVGLASWVGIARIVRGQFISLTEKEYVEAARALGYSSARIIFRHILPNSVGPIIVIVTLGFANAIIVEAGLSFLGLGVQPPTPSWGQMIYTGYGFIVAGQGWWMAVFPGFAILLAVLAFNLLGDGLRDALDIKL